MESVATDAFVVVTSRQGKRVRHKGVVSVKRGVKAGNLRHAGKRCSRGLYAGEVVRLVQGRERHEALKIGNQCIVDPCRHQMVNPTVHHTVAHDRHAGAGMGLFQPLKDRVNRFRMPHGPQVRIEVRTGSTHCCGLDGKPAPCAQAFNLPGGQERQLVGGRIDRELQGR